jgi:hypothetical protein
MTPETASSLVCSNALFHGYGEMEFQDGKVYKGQWAEVGPPVEAFSELAHPTLSSPQDRPVSEHAKDFFTDGPFFLPALPAFMCRHVLPSLTWPAVPCGAEMLAAIPDPSAELEESDFSEMSDDAALAELDLMDAKQSKSKGKGKGKGKGKAAKSAPIDIDSDSDDFVPSSRTKSGAKGKSKAKSGGAGAGAKAGSRKQAPRGGAGAGAGSASSKQAGRGESKSSGVRSRKRSGRWARIRWGSVIKGEDIKCIYEVRLPLPLRWFAALIRCVGPARWCRATW